MLVKNKGQVVGDTKNRVAKSKGSPKEKVVKKLAKPGLSLKNLLRATTENFLERSNDVHMRDQKIGEVDGNTKVQVMAKTRQSTEWHLCTIQGLSPGPISQVRVKVGCDCESYLFVSEVALHHQGSADIVYSNGARPWVTNPRMIPTLCSHLTKLAQVVIAKGL